jgi:acetyl-CoA acetyltransferase
MDGVRDIAIVGVYATTQQRRSGRTTLSLIMEAIRGALDDAAIPMSAVDGYAAHGFPAGNGAGFDDGVIAYQFGQPFTLTADASGAKAVLMAAAAIRAGLAHVVICPGGASNSAGGTMASYTRPSYEFTEWTGSMTPAQYALVARRHMYEFGTTIEQMAAVAANSHRNGRLNPEAVRFGQAPMPRVVWW